MTRAAVAKPSPLSLHKSAPPHLQQQLCEGLAHSGFCIIAENSVRQTKLIRFQIRFTCTVQY